MSVGVWTVIAVLIVANALYVAAEFGAVGVRRSRVRRMSDDGNWLARRLLPFVDSPAALDRYVGASQIGITLSSLMLGAYAQATLSAPLAPLLAEWFDLTPSPRRRSAAIVVLVTLTAVQLVLGELVPKAIALQYPTETALATVLPMQLVARACSGRSSRCSTARRLLLLRLLGSSEQAPPTSALAGGDRSADRREPRRRPARAGGTAAASSRAASRPPHGARPDGRARPADDARGRRAVGRRACATVTASPFSRLPVYRGARDHIVGMLRVKDLVERYVAGRPRAARSADSARRPDRRDSAGRSRRHRAARAARALGHRRRRQRARRSA